MNDPASDGPQEPFKVKWDSTTSHEATTTVNRFQASQVILETLKTKRRTETAQWLSGLEKEISLSSAVNPSTSHNNLSSISANPPGTSTAQTTAENTMIGQAIQWLDKMFVQFELYAAQFNMNVRGTNLVVSCTRPIKRTNDTGGLYSEAANDCLTYAGHIATQLWALVVRGCATKVEIFIIPAELLIAFSINSTDESGYEPLVVIESAWRDKEVIWHVQNNIITADQIPSLAKELFGDLIKVASGQITESELSVDPLPTTAPKEDATAGGQNQPVVNSIVSTIKSTLTASAVAPSAVPNPTPTTLNMPSVSSQTVKAASELLALIDRDINNLLESGKVALQSDNTVPFEQIKVLTETLETLKKSVSIALANIQQSSTK